MARSVQPVTPSGVSAVKGQVQDAKAAWRRDGQQSQSIKTRRNIPLRMLSFMGGGGAGECNGNDILDKEAT